MVAVSAVTLVRDAGAGVAMSMTSVESKPEMLADGTEPGPKASSLPEPASAMVPFAAEPSRNCRLLPPSRVTPSIVPCTDMVLLDSVVSSASAPGSTETVAPSLKLLPDTSRGEGTS